MLFILTIISFVEYFITIDELNQTKGILILISYSNQRIANLQYIEANIRDLKLIQLELFDDVGNVKSEALRKDSKKIIDEIDKITNYLSLNTNNPSKELDNILYNNIIKIFLKSTGTEMHDLNDST